MPHLQAAPEDPEGGQGRQPGQARAARPWRGGASAAFEDLGGAGQVLAWCFLFPVWYMFMRDRRRSTVATCAFTFMHNTGQVFFLPTRFFFTHVLLAVLLNSAFRWLRRPASDKTKYYAMESWMVDVPIVLASFGEAFACDAWLSRFGGHVWFDMVVPVMFTAYLAVLVLTGDGSREAGLGT